MTQITISSKDAERIARSFNDLIGSKGLDRIRRRACQRGRLEAEKRNPIACGCLCLELRPRRCPSKERRRRQGLLIQPIDSGWRTKFR